MAKQTIPISPAEVVALPQPPLKKAEDYLRAYSGYTYSAVTAIAQDVASINLHLFKRRFVKGKPEVDEIFEHEALSLLRFANRLMTNYDVLEATQIYLELVGEAFWIILRDEQDRPAELWPVRPDWMKVNPSATEVVDSYTYMPGGLGRDLVKFAPKDVIHFKYFNPLNPYRGKGSVQAGAMAIDIHTFSQEYNRNFFFNSALPGLVFTTEQKLDQKTIQRFMEMWQGKFAGKNNSNKVAFMGGGFKVDRLSQTAKDMDFKELQEMMRDDILAVFKVPKAILGITTDVNRANAEATTRSFMERVITPRMTKLVAHLNEFYLPNWGEEDIFFDYDDPAPEDTELKLKIYESGLSLGWLTPNEVRESENLPPVEGGDQIYISFGKIPIGTETQDPNFTPGKPDDNNQQDDEDKGILSGIFRKKTPQAPKQITLKVIDKKPKERKFMMPIPPPRLKELHRKKLEGEIKTDLIKLISNLMSNGGIQKKKTKKNKSIWTEEKRESHWKNLVAKTDVAESKFKDLLIPLFEEQKREVIQNIHNSKGMVLERMKGKETSFLFNKDQEFDKWVSVLIPYEKDVILEIGAETLEFLGVGGQLDLTRGFTDEQKKDWIGTAIDYLKEQGGVAIQAIIETTREDLIKTLSEGLAKGEGIDELAKRVEDVFSFGVKGRAEMIARTEILRASNFATNQAYRQSEIVTAKEWLTAIDERVCVWCNEMDGKIIPTEGKFFKKGDEFTVNGKTLKFDLMEVAYPPLHPSCRCTLIPVL